jgi:Tfp pilus assembly protein PilO
MDKLKQWIALTVVGVLAILAAGWFLLISPKKSDASNLNAEAATKDQANSLLVTQLAMLKAQAKNVPAQQAAFAKVAAKIPDNPELPALIRALDRAAAAANVELVSIAPSPATPVAPAAAAVTPTGPAGAKGGTGATTPTVAVASSAAAGTLNVLPVVVNVVGGYFQVEQFLDSLENLTRAFKVGTLSMTPGDNPLKPAPVGGTAATQSGKSLVATINGSVYLATGRSTAVATTPTVGK